ncbi:uridylate kinase [Spirochaetia bacterium]|nr:uridylate kinase [Spirochaetia bacterium]
MVSVISLGGSIVAPDSVDRNFVRTFSGLIKGVLDSDPDQRFIIVVGGGGPARQWQAAYRAINESEAIDDQADWIGIMATRLNAQLIKAVFGDQCTQEVVTDPSAVSAFVGRILVAAGWKPGFSSDYDAVVLAERFQAGTVYNLSNIEQVYDADPRTNPDANPLERISWKNFRALVGEEWIPGKNVPFDPVASKYAAEIGLRVICAAGWNVANLEALFTGKTFVGTVIEGESK